MPMHTALPADVCLCSGSCAMLTKTPEDCFSGKIIISHHSGHSGNIYTVLPRLEWHAVISEFYQNPLQLQLVPITACCYRVRCRYRARYDSHSNTRPIF